MRLKAVIINTLMFLTALFLLIQVAVFSALVWWQNHPVDRTTFMRTYLLQHTSPPLDHRWVEGNRINDSLRRALVAAEDARFVRHHGFDWSGMKRAIAKNNREGEIVAGGSTISQQLAKNLFLWSGRSYVRKGEEFIITWMLEHLWTKERILTVYLNSIEFGKGIYGAEAAADYYFQKPASRLTLHESAQLAALVPNPVYYQTHQNDRTYKNHLHSILRFAAEVEIP